MKGAIEEIYGILTVIPSALYGMAVRHRNAGFNRGRRVGNVGLPVISVGNLTTGGVGKSPLVARIAQLLLDHGHRPVIAMRGYKARPGEQGDEELEYRDRIEGIEVLANPQRLKALREFLPRHPEIDCVILDDGFQHRFVHRDLDLVLIDVTRNTLRDHLLPRGRLREPLENLKRADAVIITHASSSDELISSRVERYHGKPPLAWSDHVWSHLNLHPPDGTPREVEPDWLMDKTLVTLLGVGNPQPIFTQLEELGARVLANIPAGDHEEFDKSKMKVAMGLCGGVQGLFMTAKDWVKARKLIDLSSWPVPIVVPHLELDILEGEAQLKERILNAVESFVPPPAR